RTYSRARSRSSRRFSSLAPSALPLDQRWSRAWVTARCCRKPSRHWPLPTAHCHVLTEPTAPPPGRRPVQEDVLDYRRKLKFDTDRLLLGMVTGCDTLEQ